MHRKFINSKNSSGMTLVEVLTAMLILGIIIIAIFPLITQSLQATNLSHTVSSKLFGEQGEIEIVAVTDEGAILEDGTFISVKQFPVFADGNITWVAGKTVKKDDLVRFLATNQVASYYLFDVWEGYTSDGTLPPITDKSIKSGSVVNLEIKGQNNSVFNQYGLTPDGNKITISLPTDGNRLKNSGSPYIITITIDGKEKSGLLRVHLPRAVIAKSDGSLYVSSSSNPANWSNDMVSRGSPAANIKKIISLGIAEPEARFIAIGKDGSNNGKIYGWENEAVDNDVFKEIASYSGKPLNDIIATDSGLFVVGNDGTILQSTDGKSWSTKTSGTSADLNAITYRDGRFVVVGNNGIMLTSTNGSSWAKVPTSIYPLLVNNTVTFNNETDYIKTLTAPVSGSNSRTIFMVMKPNTAPANMSLFTMGSSAGCITLRTDGSGYLAVQKNNEALISTNLQLINGSTSIVACRYDSGNVTIYKDGNASANLSIGVIDTGANPVQFGSNLPVRYNDNPPLTFNGSIAEVFIFDRALQNENSREYRYVDQWYLKDGWLWTTRRVHEGDYASEMDIVQKYLCLKHGIKIADSIDATYYHAPLNETNSPILSSTNWSNWKSNSRWPITASPPKYPDMNKGKLWLDASVSSSITKSGDNVTQWKDVSGNNNHANVVSNALKSVACSDNTHFYGGGDHRNLFLYNGTTVTQDANILNGSTGRAIRYNIDDMLYAHDRFIALLNDDLGSSNKYIATLDRPAGADYADVKVTSGNALNDIFHYTPSDTLLVVGNNGTIYYSCDSVNWTNKTLSGSSNLVAGCLR